MYIVIRKSEQSMQTFISETLNDILLTNSSFKDCVFVLPSQRAGVFVKNSLRNKVENGFMPEVITIEYFTEKISKVSNIDTIQLSRWRGLAVRDIFIHRKNYI